jgi:MSHA biogenesis protein MshK
MDEAVNAFLNTTMLAFCTFAAVNPAHAASLADPTRPPPGLARAAAGPAAGAALAASTGPVLQSVLTAREPGGRQVAVIDGETVRLGASFHGAVLVRITDTEVELRRGANRQVLKLFAAAGAMTAK